MRDYYTRLVAEARAVVALGPVPNNAVLMLNLADALERSEAEVGRLRNVSADKDRAIEAEFEARINLAAERDRLRAQVQAVRALADGADDRDDVEAYWHTDTWPGGRMAVNAVLVHELRAALDTGSDS